MIGHAPGPDVARNGSIPVDPFPAIPKDLKERDQWVLWRYIQKPDKDKLEKMPFQTDGSCAKVDDPLTWTSYEDVCAALAAARSGYYAGIGYVFSADDPACGIDLDDCIGPDGQLRPWACRIVEKFADTYMEVSPSGRGIKIIANGKLSGKGHRQAYLDSDGTVDHAIEMYDRVRFFTLTAKPWREAPSQIEEHQQDVTKLYEFIQRDPSKANANGIERSPQDKILKGTRHNSLVSLAGTMRRRGFDAEAINAALQIVNTKQCEPPYDADHVRKIAESAEEWKPEPPKSQNGHSAQPETSTPVREKPEPLGAAAYYGIAGEFVRVVEPHSESDPAALLIQFLVTAGIYLDRGPYFEVESTRHYANLFAVAVGETSQGRKGTGMDRVKLCFSRAAPDFAANCFTSGLSSGEGLIYAVRNPIKEIRFKRGGTEGTNVVVDEGVSDKRLLVIESEFSRVLKIAAGPTNILTAVLRSAWDTGSMSNMTKNSRLKATDAHIGCIAHITREELTRLLTSTDAANGFGNRFLWCWSERSKCLPDGGNLPADALDGIKEALVAAGDHTYRGCPPMSRDAEARDLWHEVYPALSEGRPGLVGAITGRAAPMAMRIALIYAALDCSQSIKLAHLQAGLAVWKYCDGCALYLFGESMGDPVADELWRYLRTVGSAGATRTDISKLFGNNKSSGDITRALSVLAQHGHARFEMEDPKGEKESGGRRVERWFACRK